MLFLGFCLGMHHFKRKVSKMRWCGDPKKDHYGKPAKGLEFPSGVPADTTLFLNLAFSRSCWDIAY